MTAVPIPATTLAADPLGWPWVEPRCTFPGCTTEVTARRVFCGPHDAMFDHVVDVPLGATHHDWS